MMYFCQLYCKIDDGSSYGLEEGKAIECCGEASDAFAKHIDISYIIWYVIVCFV